MRGLAAFILTIFIYIKKPFFPFKSALSGVPLIDFLKYVNYCFLLACFKGRCLKIVMLRGLLLETGVEKNVEDVDVVVERVENQVD